MDLESINYQILLEISDKLGDEWKRLAIHLGFDDAQIRSLEVNNQGDVQYQRFKMLTKWTYRQPCNQKRVLCGALKKIDRNDIVLLVQKKWKNQQQLTSDCKVTSGTVATSNGQFFNRVASFIQLLIHGVQSLSAIIQTLLIILWTAIWEYFSGRSAGVELTHRTREIAPPDPDPKNTTDDNRNKDIASPDPEPECTTDDNGNEDIASPDPEPECTTDDNRNEDIASPDPEPECTTDDNRSEDIASPDPEPECTTDDNRNEDIAPPDPEPDENRSEDIAPPDPEPDENRSEDIAPPDPDPDENRSEDTGMAQKLKQQLNEDLDAFEKAHKTLVRERNLFVQRLNDSADELQGHHHHAKHAKVAGVSMGIVSSGLVIGGILAALFTSGTSLLVTSAGYSMALAGRVTNLRGFHTEFSTSALTRDNLVEILKQDEINIRKFKKALKRVKGTLKHLMIEETGFGLEGEERQIFKVIDSFNAVQFNNMGFEEGAGHYAFEMIVRCLALTGGMTTAVVAPPLDLQVYTAIMCDERICKQSVPQLAQNICEIAANLHCPSEQEMSEKIQRIRAVVCPLENQ